MINPCSTILLTRPRQQAEQFAQKLRAQFGAGLKIVISPVIEIVLYKTDIDVTPETCFVFTSENGVRAVAALISPQGRLAYCVGDRTAEIARQLGFSPQSAQGNAQDLLALIEEQDASKSYIYAHGANMRVDIADALRTKGFDTTKIEVYAQRAVPLTPDANSVLQDIGPIIVPIFSPRSAKLLSAAVTDTSAPLFPIALSAAVAENWTGTNTAQVADHPSADSMIAQIATILSDAST